MATLWGLLVEAEARGFADAQYGRLYRDSFTEYFKGLGLHAEYDRGWERGRDKRHADKVSLGVFIN